MPNIAKIFNDALAALNDKELKRAEELFRRVIKIDKSHVSALNLLVVVLMSMERFAEAEPFIARVTSLNQKSDVSFYNYGLISKHLNKPRQAVENFSKALSLNSNVAETWNNRGTALNDLEKYEQAIADFDKAISLNVLYSEAYSNKGKSLTLLKRYDEALAAYDKALTIRPDLAEAWLGRGNVFWSLARYDEALAAYDKALSIKLDLVAAWLGRGNVFWSLKRYDQALAAYNKALSIKPDFEDAWLGRGSIFTDLRRHDDALAAYDKALTIRPDLAEAWLGRGNIFWSLARYDEALAACDKALSIKPDLAEAWVGRGNVFWSLKRCDEALADYDKALSIKPNLESAWHGRGNVFTDLKRYDEALSAYDKALCIKSDLEVAWLGRGNVFCSLKRYDEALADYDKALSIKPDLAEAWVGRGNVFWSLKRYDEALSAYDKALSIKRDLAAAWFARGNVFADLKRYDEAFVAYDKALSIKPDLEGAWRARGSVLCDLKRYDEALSAYDKALSIEPDLQGVEGARLHTKMHLCYWDNLDDESDHLTGSVRSGKANSHPFAYLAFSDLPEDHLRCAQAWIAAEHSPAAKLIWQNKVHNHQKIRIGYVSSDLRTHPVGYLTAAVFEAHDTSRFETYAFSIGPKDNSALRSRIEKSFFKFYDVNNVSDNDIISTIKSSEIDILVDLNGHTQGERTSVFVARPAPIVINYLGYAGSMGASCYDYVIGDHFVIPTSNQKYFIEKIAYLPHCFMPHDPIARNISKSIPTRSEYGLPDDGVVFCCFNNAYKVNPSVFKCWISILDRVRGSVLWLSDMQPLAKENIYKGIKSSGIDPDRVVFAKRLESSSDHLARHQLADLFLDTLPYNAHTTASDALWAGLPVLTQIGNAFAGRVAASLLNAVGLPELITHSAEEYEALAIELALNPEKLKAIKKKLAKNRLTMPLFDTSLFTRHLEAAYDAMYQRYQAGLLPDHIEVLSIK